MTGTMMAQLAAVIDAHDWAGLPALLHEQFVCRLVHTGETFDRDAWVRFNAAYPGFERMFLTDVVAAGDREVGRAHVVGRVDGEERHYEVACFLRLSEGLIVEDVEVWTDVDSEPPPGTRAG